jgi:hypothetical protein
MAMVKCSECGHRISNKAKSCPSCGVSYDNSGEELSQLIIKLVLLGALGLFFFFVVIPVVVGMLKFIGLGILITKLFG